ncbi:MAG: basic rane protein [Candidatus Atribacteria bacterium]|nr:basic rane protein [Candidatus Atribacteria bacterium]
MKKWHFLVLAVVILFLLLPSVSWGEGKKIGLILGTGGLGDKSFNDISYVGALEASEELGIGLDYVEPKAIAEYEGYQRDFASSGGYEIIVCIGFDQADALDRIAQEFPQQKFALVDMTVDQPNVASLLFKANEGGFLLGIQAAYMTESKKIGVVGGMDIPLIRDFFVGFEEGVRWADTGAEVLPKVYVGTWADPTKGKELALSLIDQGCDLIWAVAGKSGLGALEAAKERGVYAMGVDACQCYLGDHIIASETKRVDIAVYETIKAAFDGTFQGGIMERGVAEGWIGICRLPEEQPLWEETFDFKHQVEIPLEVMQKIEEAKEKISKGEIEVPRPPEFGG